MRVEYAISHAGTPATIIIRTYEPHDCERVWALHREGVMETTPEYFEVDPKYEDDLRRIEHEYLSAGSHFWVAEVAGELVGMAAIRRIDEATGRLRRMRVTSSWRRRGLARHLLEAAERFCREQGYRRIVLDTTEQQTSAHRLYESHGFRLIGERSMGAFRVFDYEKELA